MVTKQIISTKQAPAAIGTYPARAAVGASLPRGALVEADAIMVKE